jgi:hypothetical protein
VSLGVRALIALDILVNPRGVFDVVVQRALDSLLADVGPDLDELVDIAETLVVPDDVSDRDSCVPDHRVAAADAGVLADVGVVLR